MRKFGAIRPGMLGCIGLVLSACSGPPEDAVFFKDPSACGARFGNEVCTVASEQAILSHLNNAPVSLLKEECENDFGVGNCEARYMPSNRPYYVPAMTGFLTSGGSFSEPVYRDRDDGAIVPHGDDVYRVGRFVRASVTSVRVRPATDAEAEAGANPPTSDALFRRATAERISNRGFAARSTPAIPLSARARKAAGQQDGGG